jgi:hypothetical protein
MEQADIPRRLALVDGDKNGPVEPERSPGRMERNLVGTLELLRQLGDALKRVEERARQSEARSTVLLQRANDEKAVADARLEVAEARARSAEARVDELEEWLDRIHEAIIREILPKIDELVEEVDDRVDREVS